MGMQEVVCVCACMNMSWYVGCVSTYGVYRDMHEFPRCVY